jgi:hypothetical protein
MQFYRLLLHPSASALLPLVLCDLHIWIFEVLSLCYAIPFPPATLSEHRPVCFSSGPSPCYIIPPFDAQTNLGSKSIILIYGFIFP